jgi:hypothetical protein
MCTVALRTLQLTDVSRADGTTAGATAAATATVGVGVGASVGGRKDGFEGAGDLYYFAKVK